MHGKTRIVVFVTSPACLEVAAHLRQTDLVVEEGREVERVLDLVANGPVVLVGEAARVCSMADGEDSIPTLGIISKDGDSCSGDVCSALVWPRDREHLEATLAPLRQRALVHAELRMRRACSQLLAELAPLLESNYDFGQGLHDALKRLTDCANAERSLVIAWQKSTELVHLLGASDDAGVVRMPAMPSAYPEIGSIKKVEHLWLPDAPVAARLAPYWRGDVENERQALYIVPLSHQDHVFGMVEIHFSSGATLPPAIEELGRHFAALVGPRLHGSELYRSLKEQTRRISLVEVERAANQPEMLQKYEEFFQLSVDGIVVLDGDNEVIYLNPAGAQITGYSPEGLIDTPLSKIVVEHDRDSLEQILTEVRRKEAGHAFELGLLTTSGDPILVAISTSAVLTDEDALVLSFRDITEARALSDELQATKEFLERLIDSTIDAIIAADRSGRVVLFNRGAEQLFEMLEEEVVGSATLEDLYPEGVAAKVIEQLSSSGKLVALRKEIVNKSGELVPVSLSASLIYEGEMQVGTVSVVRDLRDRLRIEKRLVRAQEKLHETEKHALVAELAGTTAHELNQPLTSVMGFAELLKKRLAGDEAIQRVVDTLLEEAERMADIVRKIGKITKYETKAYVGETQILDLDKSSE